MAKIITVITVILLLLPAIHAASSTLENNSELGDLMDFYMSDETSAPIDEQLRQLQEINGEDVVQIGMKQLLVEQQKAWILRRISVMWQMIGGLFVVLFEIIKGFFYVIEMYLIFLLLFKVIPSALIKLKEGILTWYLTKKA